ncbi:MAG: hypothetical protein IJT90_04450 [Bacteroidaceae bacterium]|nr:hypothetical protein [Bacteroidaceae bacterium]
MKLSPPLSKKLIFEVAFLAIVIILFVVKTCSPSESAVSLDGTDSVDVFLTQALHAPLPNEAPAKAHRLLGVSSYETAFPDINDEQLVSAQRHGIKPLQDRKQLKDLAQSKLEPVYRCPFYHVDNLKSSVPYLVPRAKRLLDVIGRNFTDSLQMKHLPLARLTVTSVLRTIDDVNKLQGSNVNSTPNSCHFYATTFDISYTRYQPGVSIDGKPQRLVRDDTLKWVLSEVLRDLRQAGTCHVKHERKQGCFHITVK